MSIVILLLHFGSLFLSYGGWTNRKISLKEVILSTVILFSALLILITELTSAFQILHFQSLTVSWSVSSLLLLSVIIKQKKAVWHFIETNLQSIKGAVYRTDNGQKILIAAICVLLILVLIQGIVYPPNNYDSMTYHLARTISWINHQSIAYYPTHIFRQLYQPPFSEYVILHVNLLSGSDYFSNAVQCMFLLFSLIAITALSELIGLCRRRQLWVVALAVTVPEVVLQASSTQNDIVVTFFILSFFYFAIKITRETTLKNFLFWGLSAGIGILTKGTAYLYLTPIVLVFGSAVLYKTGKAGRQAFISHSLIALSICLSINMTHYVRNYSLTHNPLGAGGSYTNRVMSPALLGSGILKNIALHLSPIPFDTIANQGIYKLHSMAGVDINHPGVNFLNIKYNTFPPLFNHEDRAPNPLHVCLLLSALFGVSFFLLKHKARPSIVCLYTMVILLQGLLFCLVLKWQPWHTRLHTPLFLASLPLVCYGFSLKPSYSKVLRFSMTFLFIYALFVAIFNCYRPFVTFPASQITSDISITDSRYKKFFGQHPDLYPEYEKAVVEIRGNKYEKIGLILAEDDAEYPLFSPFYDRMLSPIHINITKNSSKKLPLTSERIDCIVSSTLNRKTLMFKGQRFDNRYPTHKRLWLYAPR